MLLTGRGHLLALICATVSLVLLTTLVVVWLRSGPGLIVGVVVATAAAVGLAFWAAEPVRRFARAAEAFDEPEVHAGHSEVDRMLRRVQAARRRLDEQLQTITEDRNQLTAILGSMVEGLLAVDAEERLVHVNRVAVELLDLDLGAGGSSTGEHLRGRVIHELTRRRQVLEAITEALAGQPVTGTLLEVREGAGQRVLELSATPLRNGKRGIFGAVVVLHDVTQLHRLEGIRRDFVSNVSHELKTPLTAIRAFVETMTDDPHLDVATRQRFLERIGAQTARLSSLVSDLLSLSRIESSPDEERAPVDLRMPLMESLRILRPMIEEREIDLSYEVPEIPLVRVGDAEGFRQAFSNLIDNAIKYTAPGRCVQVVLARRPGRIVFEVRDQGSGIEERHLPRIFERFYRADKARSRELGGTGLGLAIVKNVAVNSGGTVEVESQPGRGSTFRMLWPTADGEPVQQAVARPDGLLSDSSPRSS